MSALGAMVGGALKAASSAASAIKNNNSSSSSGSSSSSKGSSGGSAMGNGIGAALGVMTGNAGLGQFVGNSIANSVSGALGSVSDKVSQNSAASTPVTSQPTYSAGADMWNGGYDDYSADMEWAAEQAKAANKAAVESAVAGMESSKDKVTQNGANANNAAQQIYYQTINPNGANAEQLAALGLSKSGLTESSAISAGNQYGQNVNANNMSVNEQLSAIDLAIEQARLSGDQQTAQQLQSLYQEMANTALTNGQQQQAYYQWALQNQQAQQQQAYDNGITSQMTPYQIAQMQAGIDSTKAGTAATQAQISYQQLQQQQAEYTFNQLVNSGYDPYTAQMVADNYANQLTQAQIAGAGLSNQGQQLSNTGINWDNQLKKLQYMVNGGK